MSAAVLGLLVGPVLASVGARRRAWREAVDGLSVALVGGLCLLHLAPHAIEHGGAWAILAGLAGAGVPVLLHRLGSGGGMVWPALGFTLLALHAAFDGSVLAMTRDGLGPSLALAIVAHRLPVGLAVYDVGARRSPAVAWGVIATLSIITVVGYAMGQSLAPTVPEWVDGVLEAAIAGALLHTVFDPHGHEAFIPEHHHDHGLHGHDAHEHDAHEHGSHGHEHGSHGHEHGSHGHEHGSHGHGSHGHEATVPPAAPESSGWAAPTGALLGIALVMGFTASAAGDTSLEHVQATADAFLALTLDSAPALLLGFVLAGLVSSVLDPARAGWLAGANRLTSALRGVVFGLPLPVCSCGVVPLYASLIRAGVPITAAMAFMVATPELGLDAVLLSVPLLGVPLTLTRIAAAFIAAIAVALWVGGSTPAPPLESPPPAPTRPLSQRVREGVHYGLVELVDHTFPWVAVGLVIAALAEPLLQDGALASVPALLQVPVAALVGIPVYVCASGATPLAAVALAKGLSPGAAIAFLIAGPATNVTTFGILSSLHSRALAVRFGASLVAIAVLIGWATDLLGVPAPEALDLSPVAAASRPIAWACTLGLVALALASLFRQGPRGVIDQLIRPIHED